MNLDGFIGDIIFSGDLTPFLPYLKMGEYLNVGKDASFGLGKYEISFDISAVQDTLHHPVSSSFPA